MTAVMLAGMEANLFDLGPLAVEREQKFLSVYTDRVDAEQERLLSALTPCNLSGESSAHIQRTLMWARGQHYGTRAVDRYYVAHPIRVARMMARWLPGNSTRPTEAIVACLLHNVFEKKLLTPEGLESMSGEWVRGIVESLTPDRVSLRTPDGLNGYYARLGNLTVEGRVLKVLDKLDNLLAICAKDDAPIRDKYVTEIESHVIPLAQHTATFLARYLRELAADTRRLGYAPPTFMQTSAEPHRAHGGGCPGPHSIPDGQADNADSESSKHAA